MLASLEGFASELPADAEAWLAEQASAWRDWQQAQVQDQQLQEQLRETQRLLAEAEAQAEQWQQRWQAEQAQVLIEPEPVAQPEQALQAAIASLASAQRESDALRGRLQSQQSLLQQLQQGGGALIAEPEHARRLGVTGGGAEQQSGHGRTETAARQQRGCHERSQASGR